MIFRVLGCSGSESDRNHPCSFLIGTSVVLDMGSAASRLTIEEQAQVTDIFLSHAHLDHTKDIAFFSENVFTRIDRPVTLRANEDTLRKIRENLLNNEIWPDFTLLPSQANSILKYEAMEEKKTVEVAGMKVYSVPVNHPGGCVAMFFQSNTGTILHSGDTGPTEEVWGEINKRGDEIKAILLEVSFPNHLQDIADLSGHHTPQTFAEEIRKIKKNSAPIFVYHLKAPYREETIRELGQIDDHRIRILEPGMRIEF